jgi:protein gp37
MELRIDQIQLHEDLQLRASTNWEHVEDLFEVIQAGNQFKDAPVVFQQDNVYWLADGYHRVYAFQKAGVESAEFDVRDGSFRDAKLHAIQSNMSHGLKRTNADKRRAVEMLLKDEEWAQRSDRWIAETAGVSHTTVSNIKTQVANFASSPIAGQSIPTMGMDAKKRLASPKVKFKDRVQKQKEEAELIKQELNNTFSLQERSASPLEPDDWYLVDTWQAIENRIDLFVNEGTSKGSFNDQTGDSIEWARWSWNPVTGCEHGCPYCYARDIANRFYDQKFMPSLWPNRINIPRSMNVPEIASQDISYRNVFTCSMADLFGRWVPLKWISLVMDSVRKSPEWNFLFLTKFPQRISELGELPQNAWMGTSVDCQDRVANAEKAFAKIGGGTKWLSIEPMLTPLKFNRLDLFDWVVIGGASESSATPAWIPPMDWIVDLHKQARAAGCKIYYKSNLNLPAELRIKEFPWFETPQRSLPESMKYLGIK